MEYSERLATAVRPALLADERLVAVVPADAEPSGDDRGHWARPARGLRGSDVLVREHAPPPDFPATGRLALVLTDRRLRVYRRRRLRAAPARHLVDIPIDAIGNVEGTFQPASGVSEFELMLILSDGTAVALHVPSGHADGGKEFVRRAQALLRH